MGPPQYYEGLYAIDCVGLQHHPLRSVASTLPVITKGGFKPVLFVDLGLSTTALEALFRKNKISDEERPEVCPLSIRARPASACERLIEKYEIPEGRLLYYSNRMPDTKVGILQEIFKMHGRVLSFAGYGKPNNTLQASAFLGGDASRTFPHTDKRPFNEFAAFMLEALKQPDARNDKAFIRRLVNWLNNPSAT